MSRNSIGIISVKNNNFKSILVPKVGQVEIYIYIYLYLWENETLKQGGNDFISSYITNEKFVIKQWLQLASGELISYMDYLLL